MGKKMPKLWVWPDQWRSMMSSEEISLLLSKNYEDLVLVPMLWTGVGDPILITCARQLLRCGWDLGTKEGSWQQTRGSYSDTPVVYVPVVVLQMMYLWAGGWHGDKYVSTIPTVDFSELKFPRCDTSHPLCTSEEISICPKTLLLFKKAAYFKI